MEAEDLDKLSMRVRGAKQKLEDTKHAQRVLEIIVNEEKAPGKRHPEDDELNGVSVDDHGLPKVSGDVGADPADGNESSEMWESSDASPTATGTGDLKDAGNEDVSRECTAISECGSERLYELRQSEAKMMLQRALSELSAADKRVYRNAFSRGPEGEPPPLPSPLKKHLESHGSKLCVPEPVESPRCAPSVHSNSRPGDSPSSTQDFSQDELTASSPSVSSRLIGAAKGTAVNPVQWGGAASASLGKKEPTAVSPRDLARSVPRRPLSPPRDMALSLPAGLSLSTGSIGTRPTTALRGASKGGRIGGGGSSVSDSTFNGRSMSLIAARGASGGSSMSSGPRMAMPGHGLAPPGVMRPSMLGGESTTSLPVPDSERGTSSGYRSPGMPPFKSNSGLVQPRHIAADAAEWGNVE